MNTNQKGDLTESAVMTAFLKLGHSISIPFGDNQRYDLIVDIKGELLKVQCKTALLENDSVLSFRTVSSDRASSNHTADYHGDVDLFGVYNIIVDKVYIVPVNEIKAEGCRLRLKETKNNQQKFIKWASDYEIEKVITRA